MRAEGGNKKKKNPLKKKKTAKNDSGKSNPIFKIPKILCTTPRVPSLSLKYPFNLKAIELLLTLPSLCLPIREDIKIGR